MAADRKQRTLQDLINQMQADADRFVNTWSAVGDAMLGYQNNQKALLEQLARIFAADLQEEQPQQPLQPQAPRQTVAGLGPYQAVPDYYGNQQGGLAPVPGNGYYEQGYPPQPYQEQQRDYAPASEGPIAEVLRNLRRQQQS